MTITHNSTIKLEPARLIIQKMDTANGFELLMPDNVVFFEKTSEQSFRFAISGMPKIGLKIFKLEDEKSIKLEAIDDKFDFNLVISVEEVGLNQSKVCCHFDGKFNPMMRMMITKPLERFLKDLCQKL